MRNPDEDVAYEIMRQKRLDEWAALVPDEDVSKTTHPFWRKDSMTESIPWHQKVGTVVPFSKTVDRDPNPRIPLSIPQESPLVIEVWAWTIIAVCVGLAYWWVAV